MDPSVQNKVNEIKDKKKQKGKKILIWCLLSVFVATGVFWQLRFPGITMAKTAYCGEVEHQHSEACGTTGTLICGYPEDPQGTDTTADETSDTSAQKHIHTDECYSIEYNCGLEEHHHTLECYSNPNADVESQGDWEATLPKSKAMTGNLNEDLVTVAKSQVGYKESRENYIVAENGKDISGYTRYGAWYGKEYSDWNAMFVAFCLNYADIPKKKAPTDSDPEKMRNEWDDKGIYYSAEHIPSPGNIVFLNLDDHQGSDQVGIIDSISGNDSGRPTKITVIVGDSDNKVREENFKTDDIKIMGYGVFYTEPETVVAEDPVKETPNTKDSKEKDNQDQEDTADKKTPNSQALEEKENPNQGNNQDTIPTDPNESIEKTIPNGKDPAANESKDQNNSEVKENPNSIDNVEKTDPNTENQKDKENLNPNEPGANGNSNAKDPEQTHGQAVTDPANGSDSKADIENQNQWEASLPSVKTLTGVWSEDLALIAESQLGYSESTKNFILSEDGTQQKGYTRYGAWFGSEYSDWNSIFAAFCLHYANIPQNAAPIHADPESMRAAWESLGIYSSKNHVLARGDLVFLNLDDDPDCEEIGILRNVQKDEAGLLYQFTVIIGDSEDTVRELTYTTGDQHILGYGTPQSSTDLNLEERTVPVTIYENGKYIKQAKDDAVITVSGLLPFGLIARAYAVKAEIPGQQVLRAYDVTLFRENGEVYEPIAENPVQVSIQIPEYSTEPDREYGVFYVPDDGTTPEKVKDKGVKDGQMTFDAPHFSVYALTAVTPQGTLSTVYLNGVSGLDTNSGTAAATAVKTFAQAIKLISLNGTITISGTVTVTDDQTWSMTSTSKISRNLGFTGELIHVSSTGSLTLQDIVIDGNNYTAYAPLIVNDGTLSITSGTDLKNNNNQGPLSSTATYRGNGGAIYSTGKLTMTGGTIENCIAQNGGGIYVKGTTTKYATFDLSGGTIQNNQAKLYVGVLGSTNWLNYKCAGGGVMIDDYANMTMSAGTVSGNTSAREGGGISIGWTNRYPTNGFSSYISNFTMTGGTITGNTATMAGGGLNIAAARLGTVTGGTYTNNTANGTEPINNYKTFSGGGIYIDGAWQNDSTKVIYGIPGKLILQNVVVTDNTASSYGGGYAGCAKSNTKVAFGSGSAFYSNTSSYYSPSNELYIEASGTTGGTHAISEFMLGGSLYHWTIASGSLSGTTTFYADNAYTSSSPEIQKIYTENLDSVTVSGNRAYLGGGIGCNGDIEIGEVPSDAVNVVVNKSWVGTRTKPAYITVYLLQDNVKIATITLAPDSNGVWQPAKIDNLPRTDGNGHVYNYTVSEAQIAYFTPSIGTDTDTTKNFNYKITNTAVTNATSVTANKIWNDGGFEPNRPSSIQIQLTKDGALYDSVTLSIKNNWSYTWTGLPITNSNGTTIKYAVTEAPVPGYTTTITSTAAVDNQTTTTNFTITNTWDTYQLPETGGIGTLPFRFSGLILLLGSSAYVIRRKFRTSGKVRV